MNRHILDGKTAATFGAWDGGTELYDPTGRVLGVFVPVISRKKYAGLEPPFSDEELRRAEHEEGGRSLHEILADLERRS